MGNCMNKASKHQQQQREMRRRHGERVAPEEREENDRARSIGQMLLQVDEEEEEVPSSASAAAAGVKVKVVLTRAELEWLMAQLKSGEQRLEDVLRQMGTGRAAAGDDKPPPRADGWRPRLECIHECPEAADAT